MKKNKKLVVVWFRRNLRVHDNPALWVAKNLVKEMGSADQNVNFVPLFIDPCEKTDPLTKTASRLWLFESLKALDISLKGQLSVLKGSAAFVMRQVTTQHKVACVIFPHHGTAEEMREVQDVVGVLEEKGVAYHAIEDNYLWPANLILKPDRDFYKVFSAYKRAAYKVGVRAVLPNQRLVWKKLPSTVGVVPLSSFPLTTWEKRVLKSWHPGELGAQKRLDAFLKKHLNEYAKSRDIPALKATSFLSPHLHFGEISPQSIWHAAQLAGFGGVVDSNVDCFLSELTWRDFANYLLFYVKDLPEQPFKKIFKQYPWGYNAHFLKAWQKGMTGFPFVDAGMRELWATGFMHNRLRMVVASFLVKNLGIKWQEGQRWFAQCLVDADVASNSFNWQWVAGCGADAAPYFRIFNPVTQGEKFDAKGIYTRTYVPELARLPDRYLFRPFEAPDAVLKNAGIVLGQTYPRPLVDLKQSRLTALSNYRSLRKV